MMFLLFYTLPVAIYFISYVESLTTPTYKRKSYILSAIKQSRSTIKKTQEELEPTKSTENQREEQVYGAKFFGGNAIKEELYDEVLEEQAGKMQIYCSDKDDVSLDKMFSYNRFLDKDAFDDSSRSVAQKLQNAINEALYNHVSAESLDEGCKVYSPNLKWNTPFNRAKESTTPLDELNNALDFYRRVDCAIISSKEISQKDQIGIRTILARWEISVVWPNVLQSRVLMSGTSTLIVDESAEIILKQTDKLDNGGIDGIDIVKPIFLQIQPRFWDLYHVGMTPSAELMPRVDSINNKKGAFSNYKLFEIPPRLVYNPSCEDIGGRNARNAQALPNQAFSSTIVTTGPRAQRYVPTSPIEVSIQTEKGTDGDDAKSIISWNVPVPVEFVSYHCNEMPLGFPQGNGAKNVYSYQPRRLVATLPYGGSPQDTEVSIIRKDLYERIMKDGLQPKIAYGRPKFFFLCNDAKACFTADGGLGMSVYEWRPKISKCNEVGIELVL